MVTTMEPVGGRGECVREGVREGMCLCVYVFVCEQNFVSECVDVY